MDILAALSQSRLTDIPVTSAVTEVTVGEHRVYIQKYDWSVLLVCFTGVIDNQV